MACNRSRMVRASASRSRALSLANHCSRAFSGLTELRGLPVWGCGDDFLRGSNWRWGSIMGVAYSQDLRDRVMAAVDGGLSVYSAAPLFRVSVSYIYKARRPAACDRRCDGPQVGRRPS